ncbi:MAG: thiamine phosphate synthase [Myxococcaceae bacterium]
MILITDWTRSDLLERVDAALSAGPGIAIQHRNPGADDRTFLDQGRALGALCTRHQAPLFINRRLDLALLLDAHLHLPSTGLLPSDVRPHLPGKWLSVAVHDEAEAARATGAGLALVSPVFEPLSKPEDRPPLGPEGFAALKARLPCPAFALGGVTAQTLASLGTVDGAAVIGAVLSAADPREAAAQLLQRLR